MSVSTVGVRVGRWERVGVAVTQLPVRPVSMPMSLVKRAVTMIQVVAVAVMAVPLDKPQERHHHQAAKPN